MRDSVCSNRYIIGRFFVTMMKWYKNEKKMSTENPTEAQLVDYDEADEVTVNEAPIQEEEDADART